MATPETPLKSELPLTIEDLTHRQPDEYISLEVVFQQARLAIELEAKLEKAKEALKEITLMNIGKDAPMACCNMQELADVVLKSLES